MQFQRTLLFSTLASAALLVACGGGGGDDLPADPAMLEIRPTYELADALPPEPSDVDADGSATSASLAPGRLSGGGMFMQAAAGNGESGGVSAAAAAPSIVYYTPAQIRSAYGLDALPAASTANKGVYQGSGQTIAIVGAYHDADIANELAAFSQKFGLPACAVQNIPATAALPLARPAAGSGCTISTVYATTAGGLSARAPAVNAGWKTEAALDVEWAHAIAPLARIILVEAASSGSADMQGAILLASRLGASVVSMSFGAPEFAGQSQLDRLFQSPGVSYVASSGDSGRGVSWPAVSAQVLAVGGTTLAASGASRSETAWSRSGGGLSLYTAAPSWQGGFRVTAANGAVAAPSQRAVPDVSFNADPNSGQLVYVTPANGASGWIVAGGTSISAPQWAGLLAVANAVRGAAGKAPLGNPGAGLYRSIAGNATSYAATLLDVLAGSNGSCAGCAATAGYDLVTGLGTPKVPTLLNQLAAM